MNRSMLGFACAVALSITTGSCDNGTIGNTLPDSSGMMEPPPPIADLAMSDMAPKACKAFNLFNPAVVQQLVNCANLCHSKGQNQAAYAAADYGPASSTNLATLQQFCAVMLNSIDPNNPPSSILILQDESVAMGGTPNHPYKLTGNSLTTFNQVVENWAAAEK